MTTGVTHSSATSAPSNSNYGHNPPRLRHSHPVHAAGGRSARDILAAVLAIAEVRESGVELAPDSERNAHAPDTTHA